MKQNYLYMVLIIAACMLLLLVGCEKSEQPQSDGTEPPESAAPLVPVVQGTLEFFSYDYSNPFGACSYLYTLRKQDDTAAVFSYEAMEHPDCGEMETEVDASVLAALEKLIDQYEISRWDGFHGTDPEVCDGDGFSLNVRFSNGNSIRASGSNSIPDANYDPFVRELNKLLQPYVGKLLETGPRG